MLLIIKFIILICIVVVSTLIGMIISSKYSNRVKEIQDVITGLEIFETRIQYRNDSITDCFDFIAENLNSKICRLFYNSAQCLKENKNASASDCFRQVLDDEKIFLSLNVGDIEIIKSLSISLGQTDLEGQIKNIRLVIQMLNTQLENAKLEKDKNFKMYRNMGVLAGLMVMIILI